METNSIPLDPNAPDNPGDTNQERRRTFLLDRDHHYLFDIMQTLEDEPNLTAQGRSAVSQLRCFVEATYRGPDAANEDEHDVILYAIRRAILSNNPDGEAK